MVFTIEKVLIRMEPGSLVEDRVGFDTSLSALNNYGLNQKGKSSSLKFLDIL